MASGISAKNLVFGFIAGAIATATVHELIKFALFHAGVFPNAPWSMEPATVTGMPELASAVFWGGVWGAIFAILLGDEPQGSMTMRGAALGILGPATVGVFLLIPFLKGDPFFAGGDPNLIASVLAIFAGFGATAAWLYGFMASGFKLPQDERPAQK